jgi:GT2 family glycosyltransferase
MKIIFCLPGASYSGRFLQCWTNLLAELPKYKISYGLSQHYMCNIYHVRTKCLGASIERGVNQKPFDGKLDYDYILWIDSDMVFSPEDFFKLLEHDKDVISGVYKMSDDVNYATVENMDEEFFEQWMYYPFLQDKDIEAKKGKLFKADYTGFGFLLVKYGVFEKMKYPWFHPRLLKWKNHPNWAEFPFDDVESCMRMREEGFDIWIDPKIRLGHEKTKIL